MSGDSLTRVIAATSALVAFCSLCWTVLSWRLTGPALRFHCLWYRQALVIRVFNAGRIGDTVEQMELGGIERFALTELLELPTRVEPGQSKQWVIGADHLPPNRRRALNGGWCSLLVLVGSMRQRRADIIPRPQSAPPASGWYLVPKRSKLVRFVPLTAALACSTMSTPPADRMAGAAAIAMALGFVGWITVRVLTTAPQFGRRRLERAASLLSVAIGFVGYFGIRDSSQVPWWVQPGSTAAVVAGLLLAIPQFGDYWVELPRIVRRVNARALRGGRPTSAVEASPESD